jgi:eukaryotic-like serine/threonine-protein kinase
MGFCPVESLSRFVRRGRLSHVSTILTSPESLRLQGLAHVNRIDHPTGVDYELVAEYAERYESALAAGSSLSPAAWVESCGEVVPAEVVVELIRIDMERGFAAHPRRSLSDYLEDFPALNARPELVQQIAYEEFRLRRESGEDINPREYAERYRCSVATWETAVLASSSFVNEGAQRSELIEALPIGEALPRGPKVTPSLDDRLPFAAGQEIAGFDLLVELGRGTFSKVFLARQRDLAERYVVVKLSTEVTQEPSTLARLRHPQIGAIHSLHRLRDVNLICMPLQGLATLHDLLASLPGRQSLFVSRDEYELAVRRIQARRARHLEQMANEPGVSRLLQPWHESSVTAEASVRGSRRPTRASCHVALLLVRQLARGLEHAHASGFTHGDLKPANILLQADGSPVLVDFNLAQSMVPQLAGSQDHVGGTVAYMAPEQLVALLQRQRTSAVDSRTDLYALGLIALELLTAIPPFASPDAAAADVRRVYRDRKSGHRQQISLIREASPAAAAICERLTAFDPDARYSSARELLEDLDCYLAHRPLSRTATSYSWERFSNVFRRQSSARKLALVSAIAVLLVAVLSSTLVATRSALMARQAQQVRQTFLSAKEDLHFRTEIEGLELPQLLPTLGRIQSTFKLFDIGSRGDWQKNPLVATLSPSEQRDLREHAADLLLLGVALSERVADAPTTSPEDRSRWTQQAVDWANAACNCFDGTKIPRVVCQQQANLALRQGQLQAAAEWQARVAETPIHSAFDHYLAARQALREQSYKAAITEADTFVSQRPQDLRGWLILHRAYEELGDHRGAALASQAAVVIRPDYAPLHRSFGLAAYRLGRYQAAVDAFDRAMRWPGDHQELLFQRALAKRAAGDVAGAVLDSNEVLAKSPENVRVLLFRSECQRLLGEVDAAERDRELALKVPPTNVFDWLARGLALCPHLPHEALEAFRMAEQIQPDSIEALQNRAYVESELLKRPEAAIQTLDRALELREDYVPSLIGRAVLLARSGQHEQARRDADRGLQMQPDGATHFQAGCVYALTSRDDPAGQADAIRLVLKGLALGFGTDLINSDPDLDNIRNHTSFELIRAYQRVVAPMATQASSGRGDISHD